MQIKKILLVDDEKHVRRIAEISLSTVPEWQVRTASSGPEAIERVSEEAPDLILIDVRMPGMDGIETVRQIRNLNASTDMAVILLSGSDANDLAERDPQLNISGLITKPYNAAQLPQLIRNILQFE